MKLSTQQAKAVTHDGNVLLTACPGSGKTRVIIQKLAYEADRIEPASKRRIAALTFTTRASDEIHRRLHAMGFDNTKVWTGTLHSFCYEWIIKPYSCYLPELSNGFVIADEYHCGDILDALKVKHGIKSYDKVSTRIGRDGLFIEKDKGLVAVLSEYHSLLKFEKAIDFDQIVFLSYSLLLNNNKIRTTLNFLFKLICVDEYQDTQDLFYAIISLIVTANPNNTSLFLVGDADQAIYTTLGGVVKDLHDISAEIGGLHVTPLSLTGNYRSPQRIIDFYSNFQSTDSKITAVGKNANLECAISYTDSISKSEIVNEIARLIKRSLDRGIPEREICVLVPQWWLFSSVARKLRAALSHVNFDASGMAPMSKNRDNIWYKFSRLFLAEPCPRLFATRHKWATEVIEELSRLTHSDFQSTVKSTRVFLRRVNAISSTKEIAAEFLNDCFDQFLDTMQILIESFPLLKKLRVEFFQALNKRLADPDINPPNDTESFKRFYKEINGVVINTCAGVKGEEYDTVIAYGLLKGYIPHWSDVYSGDGDDASRRQMYVICSRAKRNLHLISERGRTTKSGTALITTPVLSEVVFAYDKV